LLRKQIAKFTAHGHLIIHWFCTVRCDDHD